MIVWYRICPLTAITWLPGAGVESHSRGRLLVRASDRSAVVWVTVAVGGAGLAGVAACVDRASAGLKRRGPCEANGLRLNGPEAAARPAGVSRVDAGEAIAAAHGTSATGGGDQSPPHVRCGRRDSNPQER